MGVRGPVPNRDEDLARPRHRKGGDVQDVTVGQSRPAVIPNPDPEWHPIAAQLWEALRTSGQADFYQSSDWAIAYSLCDDISYYKRAPKRSGQMLTAIYSAMSTLLLTEGDRRRVRVELRQPEPSGESASVTAIAEYRRRLGVG
jgi:hypothetical protein